MELISVRELFKNTAAYADKTVTVGGWVRNRRPSKQFGFIMLNDGTYFNPIQVVYTDAMGTSRRSPRSTSAPPSLSRVLWC